ncbi:Tim44/TimA family putative adaptor protein [Candidatus Paracaedibacter symbiosus]|uniref:Tim44/TimA family putative adaptor protein n=1 Tax=Candidatus Paracaedibacter symbiosus TaxID=244582 RepID=UPI000690AC24|nr:Tim44/TimA family putative adaptor protein [Candidatus Paracaedibacter symbiosus]
MEIIFLALITAYLIYRLWMVLGQETDEDQQRRDNKLQEFQAENNVVHLPIKQSIIELSVLEEALKPGARAGLEALKRADPSFNLDQFIAGAQSAYEMIVIAFANGDLDTLKNLLTRKVFGQFEAAIATRTENNLKLETSIEKMERLDIDSIELIDSQVNIAMRFKTTQIRVTYDEAGTIIDNPAKIATSITDVWTFTHNINAKDPTWYLAATKTETNPY